jgi:hypothetical protein
MQWAYVRSIPRVNFSMLAVNSQVIGFFNGESSFFGCDSGSKLWKFTPQYTKILPYRDFIVQTING